MKTKNEWRKIFFVPTATLLPKKLKNKFIKIFIIYKN